MDKNIRVLIVDDFATMRRIIKNFLADLGFMNTEEADDGSRALPMLEESEFGLVIIDWNMPQMNGMELLKKIRAHDKLKTIPVLMVTAETKREQIVEAAACGVSGYIIKPFTAKTLEEKIKKAFQTGGPTA